jgi:hypothetical protein
MSVDPKYRVSLKGKDFVLYAGLLDLAHRSGLVSFEVNVLQYPAPENGNVTVCQATANFEGGRFFTEIGDASPANTSAQIALHAVRMAATRAKGRALRDALNIGEVMFEELADREDEPAVPGQRKAPPAKPATQPAVPRARHDPKDHAGGKGTGTPCEWPGCGVLIEDEQQVRISTEYANHPLCVHHEGQLRSVRSKKAEKAKHAEADLLAAQVEAEANAASDELVLQAYNEEDDAALDEAARAGETSGYVELVPTGVSAEAPA